MIASQVKHQLGKAEFQKKKKKKKKKKHEPVPHVQMKGLVGSVLYFLFT
jgi:hypothetical protein